MLRGSEAQELEKRLCAAARLGLGLGWIVNRYAGAELGHSWRGYVVETLGMPVERYGGEALGRGPGGLVGWGAGPVEEAPPFDDYSGVVLLRFRLVRHDATGLELGAHWRPQTGHDIARADAGRGRAQTAAGLRREQLLGRLLVHRAWRPLRRPTTIDLGKRRGRPRRTGVIDDLTPHQVREKYDEACQDTQCPSREDVATRLGISESSIVRFMKGRHLHWPPSLWPDATV